jgi:hypothetical protein
MVTLLRLTTLPAAVVLLGLDAACASRPSAPPSAARATTLPIMGTSRLRADQLTRWFNSRQPRPSGTYAATVPVETLAAMFVEEGAAEAVTGDVAFAQAIVETGWFRFAGLVPASFNNFAGIGANDRTPASFPDARTGVRAQIQHLRAYADPAALACVVPPLTNPCVDPRFNLVVPKGKAPTWNRMGNGNWASLSTYADRILNLYSEARAFSGVQ